MLDKNTFFKDHLIVHTHVPKAAGSSIVTACRELFGKDQVYHYHGSNMRPKLLSADARSNIRVITGHFSYGVRLGKFPRKRIYIASARDPVSRFNSYYRFVLERPFHKGYPGIIDLSFDEVVRKYIKEEHKTITNRMARILSGKEMNCGLEAIKQNLENNYWIVVPQPKMDDFLLGFFQLFGETKKEEEKITSKLGSGHSAISPETAALISAHNPLDTALYDFVCQRYADWRLNMADRILR